MWVSFLVWEVFLPLFVWRFRSRPTSCIIAQEGGFVKRELCKGFVKCRAAKFYFVFFYAFFLSSNGSTEEGVLSRVKLYKKGSGF